MIKIVQGINQKNKTASNGYQTEFHHIIMILLTCDVESKQ